MRGWGIFPAVLVALCIFYVSGAQACSCAPQPPGESLRESDGAIVGRLVKVLPHGPLHAVYRYEMLHVYKGGDVIEAGKMLDVHSSRRAAACALPRRTGRSYGLFLSQRNGRWFGGICGVILPKRLRAAAQNRPRTYRRSAGQGAGCA